MATYKIIRHYYPNIFSGKTVRRGLTLAEAQAHCADPETSSSTCTSKAARRRTRQVGQWFDGFEKEGAA